MFIESKELSRPSAPALLLFDIRCLISALEIMADRSLARLDTKWDTSDLRFVKSSESSR